MYQTIKYEVKENIGYVTINRPEALNALNKTVLEELFDVFNKIDDDDAVIFKERKRLLFLGLPWTFTKYTVTPSFITVESGLLSTTEDDCYMYKVADVKLTTSLMERIFKLGTIVCYTGDVTNPELKLVHIKHSREIKSYLLKQSEAARLKRRTLNTVDIGAHGADMADLDHDGIADSME